MTANLKAKLLFLVSHSSAGGAQEIWSNLAESFRLRGYDTTLMALYPYRDTVRETATLDWTYVVPKRPTSPLAQIGMINALSRYLKTHKPDVVFTAMPAANVMAPLAIGLAGVKTKAVISHHTPVNTYSRGLNYLDGIFGSKKQVSTIVSVSDAVGKSLSGKSDAYRKKRLTIYNALPPQIENRLEELSRLKPRNGAIGRLVVATGRLAYQKNYPLLLKAAVHMPDVTIQIVGNGPDEETLRAQAISLGVADRVTFLGHKPRTEALEILASADVFTQPSLFEGHSLALIEAAKLQLPLVVSDVPVQVEGITASDGERCGIAVGTDDAEGLAREILRLLDDPDYYQQWTARARRLGAEATYERMLAAYENLIG